MNAGPGSWFRSSFSFFGVLRSLLCVYERGSLSHDFRFWEGVSFLFIHVRLRFPSSFWVPGCLPSSVPLRASSGRSGGVTVSPFFLRVLFGSNLLVFPSWFFINFPCFRLLLLLHIFLLLSSFFLVILFISLGCSGFSFFSFIWSLSYVFIFLPSSFFSFFSFYVCGFNVFAYIRVCHSVHMCLTYTFFVVLFLFLLLSSSPGCCRQGIQGSAC